MFVMITGGCAMILVSLSFGIVIPLGSFELEFVVILLSRVCKSLVSC